MWDLRNRSPFAAARAFARDIDGAEVLLVVVKATFTFASSGAVRLADEQLPARFTPTFNSDPAGSSLAHECDFALRKQQTDVLLLGSAYARGERPAAHVKVGVRVGEWSKRLVVFGDRRWARDGRSWRATSPEPFLRMPLVYERAFGGPGCDENPVGVGSDALADSAAGSALPNLEDAGDLLHAPGQKRRPMAFGPIARHWPARARLSGTYDDRWRRERRPLLPRDFDDAFYQSAPADQRMTLRGGEPVELEGVSPRGTLRFTLPQVSLMGRSRVGSGSVEHGFAFHTLIFEPDEGRFSMAFSSALLCHETIQSLRRTTIEEVAA